MTVQFTLTVLDGTGVDTSFMFPGLRQVRWQGTAITPYGGSVAYDAGSDFPQYLQEVIASPVQISDYGHGIQGHATALGLARQTTAGGDFVEIAHLSVDFQNSQNQYFEVGDSLSMTPSSMLNVVSFYDSVSFKAVGNAGADKLYGSGYADILDGQGGIDTLIGGDGADRYFVDNAKDVVVEAVGGGSDYVLASTSYTLQAGAEIERLSTTNTNATTAITLAGNEFGQRIEGNAAANKIMGFDGADTLYGNAGGDALYGGNGKDVLIGGLGNDSFMFDTALGSANIDTISDFHNVSGDNDTIRLENAIFTKLAATGALAAGFFAANATGAAADSNDYIVYNTSTGALFYDADGNGAGKAVQFATLTGHPTLTAADFFVT